MNSTELIADIKQLSADLGFDAIGIANIEDDLDPKHYFIESLQQHGVGDMHYLLNNIEKRMKPNLLFPNAKTAICCLAHYAPPKFRNNYIAAFALDRDYHKIMRKRLKTLAQKIQEKIGQFNSRAFCDSAPVLEKSLAAQAGLGWIGKNTLLLSKRGSYCFLGEIYTDLALPIDKNIANPSYCGNCQRCINACPTKALHAPYKLNAERCIAYLTIEHKGAIPEELRTLMGARIFGCDTCQKICPWNRFAPQIQADAKSQLTEFKLHELMNWSEEDFFEQTSGMSIRRIGHERWLRNIAVALGNSAPSPENMCALEFRKNHPSELVREHVTWAVTKVGK